MFQPPTPHPLHPDILIISPKCTACICRWISPHRKLLACRTDAKFLIDRWRECHVAVGRLAPTRTLLRGWVMHIGVDLHFIHFQANKWGNNWRTSNPPSLPTAASVIPIAAEFHCVASVSKTDFNLRAPPPQPQRLLINNQSIKLKFGDCP